MVSLLLTLNLNFGESWVNRGFYTKRTNSPGFYRSLYIFGWNFIKRCRISRNLFYIMLCHSSTNNTNLRMSYVLQCFRITLFFSSIEIKDLVLLSQLAYTCSKSTMETPETCGIFSKLTVKTQERHQWRRFGVVFY